MTKYISNSAFGRLHSLSEIVRRKIKRRYKSDIIFNNKHISIHRDEESYSCCCSTCPGILTTGLSVSTGAKVNTSPASGGVMSGEGATPPGPLTTPTLDLM